MQKKVGCPVCKVLVFNKNEFPGSYLICPNCGWEDDELQYLDADYEGGANDVSLNQAIKNFKKYGISDPNI
jgi:hypothetical protein